MKPKILLMFALILTCLKPALADTSSCAWGTRIFALGSQLLAWENLSSEEKAQVARIVAHQLQNTNLFNPFSRGTGGRSNQYALISVEYQPQTLSLLVRSTNFYRGAWYDVTFYLLADGKARLQFVNWENSSVRDNLAEIRRIVQDRGLEYPTIYSVPANAPDSLLRHHAQSILNEMQISEYFPVPFTLGEMRASFSHKPGRTREFDHLEMDVLLTNSEVRQIVVWPVGAISLPRPTPVCPVMWSSPADPVLFEFSAGPNRPREVFAYTTRVRNESPRQPEFDRTRWTSCGTCVRHLSTVRPRLGASFQAESFRFERSWLQRPCRFGACRSRSAPHETTCSRLTVGDWQCATNVP